MLYEDLFLKNYNIKIIKYTNLELEKKNLTNKKKNIRFLNSLNIDIVASQARKIISKKYIKVKKNLIIEPLWDLFYYKYDLKKI